MAESCPQCISFRMRRPVSVHFTLRARRKVTALKRLGLSLHTKALQRALYMARGRALANDGMVTLAIPPGVHLVVRFAGPRAQYVRVLDISLAPALARTRGPYRERRSVGLLFGLLVKPRDPVLAHASPACRQATCGP